MTDIHALWHSATLKQMLRINGDIRREMLFAFTNIAHTSKEYSMLTKNYAKEVSTVLKNVGACHQRVEMSIRFSPIDSFERMF